MDVVISKTRMDLRHMLSVLLVSIRVSTATTSSPGPGGLLGGNRTVETSPTPPSSSPASSQPPVFGYRSYQDDAGSTEDPDSGAQGIHLLLRPPDLLSPSLAPPLPTFTPPPPHWENGEETWGSGDYLETLSFMVPDGEELTMPNGDDWSFNTVFPARPTLPLTSPSHTRPAHPDLFPTWDEDYDPEDLDPLEPTEVLLPDMNSMEYYTNLLARERGNRTLPTPAATPLPTPAATTLPTSAAMPLPTPANTLPLTPAATPLPTPAATPPLAAVPPTVPANLKPDRVPPRPPSRLPPPPPFRPPQTKAPPTRTTTPLVTTPTRQYMCNVSKPELYLVRVVNSKGSSAGFSQIRDFLRRDFNRSVELQFLRTPSSFAFRAVSGGMIFTAVSVLNALRRAPRVPAVAPLQPAPAPPFQVHSILQFVPNHVDIRLCNFSERLEKGLLTAYMETRRRNGEMGNVTVQLLNITVGLVRPDATQKVPVDITFAVRDGRGYLQGSEVSEHLRKLSLVEFSFYVGFPTQQIAEPLNYPELNITHHLRSTWVRTVMLGVQEQMVAERSFKARLERRLALLLEEGLQETSRRRWRRATAVGNNSLQVVRVSRLSGPEHPLEVFYFVEGPGGERISADVTAATMNRLDLQRAAIVLGHKVQRPLAKPVETLSVPPAETKSSSIWLIVGVVVPVLLAVFIIIILYWKLCGSEKLEFQPDAINTIQQRQKLQAPSVKGFDFAKLHLGQHSKDDIRVIQEPGSLPVPTKEATPSDGGDLNTPKSKTSATKVPRSSRRRGRLSPTERDSLGSDQSSGRDSAEESTRPVATPSEGTQHRKTPKNGRTKMAPPPGSGPDEHLSSSSIFDHVDRLSRGSSDGNRRQANKVQLIAMQPRPSPPPQLSPSLTEKVNTEVALRHKSEIEHHRNKLRQRAKRRGQCEFPSMDDIMDAFGDGPVQSEVAQRLYSSAHDHMDCILQADASSPPTPPDSRKRGRRSPRGRHPPPGPGSLPDTDRDRLLMDQSATYRKYPGLNNVAYMSDPDLPPDTGSPSPTDEVFDPAPPPYMPPQPSIEEARQQMHSLLDDAFALVSPSSQGSAGISGRYGELGTSPTSIQALLQRQGLGSGGYISTGDQESVYSNRGQYEDLPSSCRPRPVGGSTGAQLHHLTQVGLSSQMGAFQGVGRSLSGPTGSSWHHQQSDQDLSRPGASRETVMSFPDFSSSVFQMSSSSLRDPPPLVLTSPTPEYCPEDSSPSTHTSASLIKAIREELQRLAQNQTIPSYQ